jgi:hypothetical protein
VARDAFVYYLLSVRGIDVPIPSVYVQVTLPLAQLTLHPAGLFTVILMYAHIFFSLERLIHIITGLSHPPGAIGNSSYVSWGKALTCRFSQPQQSN